MKDLGQNIRLMRLELNLSQVDLSNLLGISQTSIAHYEKGTRQPTIETLVQLSLLFNVSIESLIGVDSSAEDTLSLEEIKDKLPLMESYLLNKKEDDFIRMFTQNIENKYSIEIILYEIVQPILYNIGSLWEKGKISEADEHYATNVIRKMLHHLSHIQSEKIKSTSVVTYAISSEKHTIGIEMLNTYLQYHNIGTIYLGSNVPFESIIDVIDKQKPDSVLISVTLDAYLHNLSRHIKDLIERFGSDLRIIVGGQGVLHNDYTLDYDNVFVVRDNNKLINLLK